MRAVGFFSLILLVLLRFDAIFAASDNDDDPSALPKHTPIASSFENNYQSKFIRGAITGGIITTSPFIKSLFDNKTREEFIPVITTVGGIGVLTGGLFASTIESTEKISFSIKTGLFSGGLFGGLSVLYLPWHPNSPGEYSIGIITGCIFGSIVGALVGSVDYWKNYWIASIRNFIAAEKKLPDSDSKKEKKK